MHARRVLADCGVALERAQLAMDPVDFRVSWAALVALLRAVGHVLKKVDAQQSESLRRAVDTRWQCWREDRASNQVFWCFIESERNNVLKAYDFGYREDDVQVEEVQADGTRIIHSNVPFLSQLQAGPFAGQPGLTVAKQALSWWAVELDAVEAAANEHGA